MEDNADNPSSPESPHSSNSPKTVQNEDNALSEHLDTSNHSVDNSQELVQHDNTSKTIQSFQESECNSQTDNSNTSNQMDNPNQDTDEPAAVGLDANGSNQSLKNPEKTLLTNNKSENGESNDSTGNAKTGNSLINCNNSNESAAVSVSKESSRKRKMKSDSDSDEESEGEEVDRASVVYEIQSDSESEDNEVKAVAGNEESDEMDSGEESEEGTDGSNGNAITGTLDEDLVSINSDSEPEAIGDDSSKDSQNMNTRPESEILLIDDLSNHGENKMESKKNGTRSPVVHEIVSDNDDCVVESKTNPVNTAEKKPDRLSLRRTSRNTSKFSDTKNIITVKQSPSVSSKHKEASITIINTKSLLSGKAAAAVRSKPPPAPANFPSQTLYQSIAACGTTVTPVSAKTNTPKPNAPSTTPAPVILPSLSDDMFVVEAPSFIVPYVYEKPSVKPFREFVDNLGKDLEKIRQKEEQERLAKEEANKLKQDQNKKDKVADTSGKDKEDASPVDDGKMGAKDSTDAIPQSKKEKKGRRKRNEDEDDVSWDGESTSDSDDEAMSDDDTPKTIIIKEKEDVSLDDANVPDVTVKSKSDGKSDNYFENSLGTFFINIGAQLVQEYVQNDLLKLQKRKLYKENKLGSQENVKATESAISSLLKNLEFSKENNAPYKFQQKKCEYCSFKTESVLTMAHHMETPHMKNNLYKCNFCPFEVKSPHEILYHMEAEHNIRGRLERAPAYHPCANCPFEDNGKGKLARHLVVCTKKFKPDHNLTPPLEWEPPAKIIKISSARHGMVSAYPGSYARNQSGVARSMQHLNSPQSVSQMYRGRGRSPASTGPVHGAPLVRGGVMFRSNTPKQVLLPSNYQLLAGGQTTIKPNTMPHHRPTISITPLTQTPQPPPLAPIAAASISANAQSKSTFVICEICDGYIKDLEQLGNHMQWIHKVKIHPKMIHNRPPLNCQKCQFRFFTDQGLERHLLGSHGLVTNSMQEAANIGKDAGRCPVCGKVYQWKLLFHVSKDHNMTLKPAHLSYKCTVCTATFGMYKLFENHVYSAHSVVAKRVSDKNKGTPSSASSSKSSVPTKSS